MTKRNWDRVHREDNLMKPSHEELRASLTQHGLTVTKSSSRQNKLNNIILAIRDLTDQFKEDGESSDDLALYIHQRQDKLTIQGKRELFLSCKHIIWASWAHFTLYGEITAEQAHFAYKFIAGSGSDKGLYVFKESVRAGADNLVAKTEESRKRKSK
jgi:hypothetical protein